MKTQHIFILIVAVLILGGAGYAFSQQGKQDMAEKGVMMEKDETSMDDTKQESMTENEGMEEQKDDMVKDDAMMDKETMVDDGMKKGAEIMKGSYELYSSEKLARAETGKVLLFFYASWCPTCRALDADIKNNLEELPDNVSILQLNFDTETELRKKYGVTVQHTLVQVNARGDQITKWSGGNTLAYTLSQLQ